MELWQINSSSALQNVNQVSQSKVFDSSSVTAKFEYAKILAEKIANAREDMERMNEIQEELDENEKLHEELTGKSPNEEDSDGSKANHETTETIKRFMPDGSIMFMKVQGGEVIEQFKKKPHFVAVADPSAPKSASGGFGIKMKAIQHLDLFSLLI